MAIPNSSAEAAGCEKPTRTYSRPPGMPGACPSGRSSGWRGYVSLGHIVTASRNCSNCSTSRRSRYGARVTRQVLDLTTSGYMGKDKDGSETATTIQARLPLREAVGGEQTVGDVLDVVVDTNTHTCASRDRR